MNIKLKQNVVVVVLLVALSYYAVDYNRNFQIITQQHNGLVISQD